MIFGIPTSDEAQALRINGQPCPPGRPEPLRRTLGPGCAAHGDSLGVHHHEEVARPETQSAEDQSGWRETTWGPGQRSRLPSTQAVSGAISFKHALLVSCRLDMEHEHITSSPHA